jgi:hypothetical protein
VLGTDVAQRQCFELGEVDEVLAIVAPVLLVDGTPFFFVPGGRELSLETRGSASLRGAAGPVTPSASVWWTVRSRAVDRGVQRERFVQQPRRAVRHAPDRGNGPEVEQGKGGAPPVAGVAGERQRLL